MRKILLACLIIAVLTLGSCTLASCYLAVKAAVELQRINLELALELAEGGVK